MARPGWRLYTEAMLLRRLLAAHPRTFAAFLIAIASYFVLPATLAASTRSIVAWDLGSLVLIALVALLFFGASPAQMAMNARIQEEGEWTVFALTAAGAAFSFGAIVVEFSGAKDSPPGQRGLHFAIVVATLALSWLVTHTVFALRYAHEFYAAQTDGGPVDGGLEFPGEPSPDYWDFAYFSIVLGMTFQVSDVQVTSRTLRWLATVHGLLSFVFNTVIVALTVNLAANLL